MRLEKKFNRFILCLAVILAFAFVQSATCGEERPSGTVAAGNPAEAKDHQVVVYYFHGNKRCLTCKKIERLTQEAVKEFFSDEINTGLVTMKVINVDEPENSHFAKDYQLFTKSVVVSDTQNGKEKQWKNLQRIWELVHNDGAFKTYIRDEIKAYLS
jgi:hypothetical protein